MSTIEKRTIKEIRSFLKTITDEEDPRVKHFSDDERKGVQSALKSWKREIKKKKQLITQFQEMSAFENAARSKGHELIAGVDEVGRGPLAGPVVAAAVILPENELILGLNDSKQLPKKVREQLFESIHEKALAIGVGVIEASEIDRINIYQASKIAMLQSVNNLNQPADYLLIDAMAIEKDIAQEKLIKGDTRSVSIAAASIIAKVTRDRIMDEYDKVYPGYGFSSNSGYGTQKHLEGLNKLGITPIHRRSFSPVKQHLV